MALNRLTRLIVKITALLIIVASSAYIFNFGTDQRDFSFTPKKKIKNSQNFATTTKKDSFPEKEGESLRTFNWIYKGEEYSVSQKLHRSVYSFYSQAPKDYVYTGDLPDNWEEEYYGMFLGFQQSDSTLAELALKIEDLGKRNNLDDDEIVELVLAFVQTIDYDQSKADNILGNLALERISYPYEVLFESKGVCSDKSFLFISLVRELGYGTAVFVFDDAQHMAPAIKCPKQYSNYGSGYCYAETTAIGHKIGVIPEFDLDSNTVSGSLEAGYFDEQSGLQSSTIQLDSPEIFQESRGEEYEGVVETMKATKKVESLRQELDKLLTELNDLLKDIRENEAYLEKKKDSMEEYKEEDRIKKYNEIAEKYNDALEEYLRDYDEYSRKVKIYNSKVAEYNSLIKKY